MRARKAGRSSSRSTLPWAKRTTPSVVRVELTPHLHELVDGKRFDQHRAVTLRQKVACRLTAHAAGEENGELRALGPVRREPAEQRWASAVGHHHVAHDKVELAAVDQPLRLRDGL